MQSESHPQTPESVLAAIDTGKMSLVHGAWQMLTGVLDRLFGRNESPASRSYIFPFVLTMTLGFGSVFLAAWITLDPAHFALGGGSVMKPFLTDWNVICQFVLTLPTILTLLLTQRAHIPRVFSAVVRDGVAVLGDQAADDFRARAESRYKRANVRSQAIGLLAGVAVALANYSDVSNVGHWAGGEDGINIAGVVWLFWLVVFYFVVFVYIARVLALNAVTADFMQRATIEIVPFHPDNCGGLGPLGTIVTRYLFLVAAINVVALIEGLGRLQATTTSYFIVAGAVLLFIFVSALFVSPVLELRGPLRKKRSELVERTSTGLKEHYEMLISSDNSSAHGG